MNGFVRNVGLVVVGLFGVGCVRSSSVDCADGRTCPIGTVCLDTQQACVSPNDLAACEGKAPGDTCADDGSPGRACRDGACLPITEYPLSRTRACAAYDSDRGRVVMFGGNHLLNTLNDLWEWNGADWVQLASPSGSQAPRLDYCSMAYDSKRHQLLVRGLGPDRVGFALWMWDGKDWNALAQPPPRPYSDVAPMAYDPLRDQVVLVDYDRKTWAWNGATWEDATPTSGESPPSLWAAIAFDKSTGRIVLRAPSEKSVQIGPDTTSCLWAHEIWEWDGAQWSQRRSDSDGSLRVCGAAPPFELDTFKLAYDQNTERMILFGGSNDKILHVFEWNSQAGELKDITAVSCCSPENRSNYTVATDEARGTIVMSGGSYEGISDDATWVWSATGWTKLQR